MAKTTIAFENKGNVRLIAHRGLSGLERENTCSAFVAAGVKSFYGIEADARITKDGKFIIIHDDDTSRVSSVKAEISENDFEFLRSIRLQDTDGTEGRADLFLPTIKEYLSICKKYGKQAVLEIKPPLSQKQTDELIELVKQAEWLENTTFISFDGENLIKIRKRYPKAAAQFLFRRLGKDELRFLIDNRLDADMNERFVGKEEVEALHAEGLKVNCWTVDSLKRAEKLRDYGVDFITTNILE